MPSRSAHEDTHLPKTAGSAPFQSVMVNDKHSNAFQASLHAIMKNLDAEDVLPYLLATEVIHGKQAQEIMAIPYKPARNIQLIGIIKAAGPSAFQELINALHKCNNYYLADKVLIHLPYFFTQQLTLAEQGTAENSVSQATSSSATSAVNSNSGAQMNEEHSNAWQAILHDICQDLDTEDVLPYLLAIEVVQAGQAQEIMAIPHTFTRNMQLITVLKAAGPSAFQEFFTALKIFDQVHLADKLRPHLDSFFTQQLTLSEMSTTQQCSAPASSNPGNSGHNSGSQVDFMEGLVQAARGNNYSGDISEQQ
uniref:CARD domain-containing protein n=1 Tax=Plectus sambesii TaxID=2011161 RepID=A0A914VM86_9BILA